MPDVIHYAVVPYTAVCGAAVPNQTTTPIGAHATCALCKGWLVLQNAQHDTGDAPAPFIPGTAFEDPSPPTAPHLPRDLDVRRLRLDSALPYHNLELRGLEYLVYALVGRFRIYRDGRCLGTFGGRGSVTEPSVHAVRFPAGSVGHIDILLDGWAADYLFVSCHADLLPQPHWPYMHWNDTIFHTVGSGSHQRRVGEVPTPDGFTVSCGETLNQPGAVSSWPAHANAEDLARYAAGETTWEETFYIVCPRPGAVELDGLMPDRQPRRERITLTNGDIVPMVLGAHPVTAHAESWLYYTWFYCGNALQKRYNRFSTDCLVYVK